MTLAFLGEWAVRTRRVEERCTLGPNFLIFLGPPHPVWEHQAPPKQSNPHFFAGVSEFSAKVSCFWRAMFAVGQGYRVWALARQVRGREVSSTLASWC